MKLIKGIKSAAADARINGGDVFAAFVFGFVLASVAFSLGGSFLDLAYVRQYPLWIPAVVTVIGFLFIMAPTLLFRTKRILAAALLAICVWYALILVYNFPDNVFFCLGMAGVLVLVARYVADGDKLRLSDIKLTDIQSIGVIAFLVAAFTITVYAFTAAKYKSFYHSTFDFGIFCQMFEGMAETGLPMTTVERSKELSHFAVHFSPFYYVLLPGYLIFRTPLYLLFVQALGVALGAFPVRRICRSLGLSAGEATVCSAVYLLFPTMANGCFCDFHENKFLSVLILWALAFVLEKNRVGFLIFAFLILTVKEDAFIYVLAICLWMFVTKRYRGLSVICALASFGWFFFACSMIELSGGEIMTGRFSNYVSGGQGTLVEAVRTCFIDIGYLFKEVFAGADTEAFREMTYTGQKLEFILWTCTPLLFTPFLKRRPSEMVLLLPLLVVNLMPRWMYQYNVDFQYTYGTAALLVFAALTFLSERPKRQRSFAALAMLCICLVFSCTQFVPKAESYKESYYNNREKYDATEKALAIIDREDSVTAYGYIAPHLWYVKDLHTCPEYYAPYEKTDYYVIDARYDYDNHTAKMYEAMGDDYEMISEEGYIRIYRLITYEG